MSELLQPALVLYFSAFLVTGVAISLIDVLIGTKPSAKNNLTTVAVLALWPLVVVGSPWIIPHLRKQRRLREEQERDEDEGDEVDS